MAKRKTKRKGKKVSVRCQRAKGGRTICRSTRTGRIVARKRTGTKRRRTTKSKARRRTGAYRGKLICPARKFGHPVKLAKGGRCYVKLKSGKTRFVRKVRPSKAGMNLAGRR